MCYHFKLCLRKLNKILSPDRLIFTTKLCLSDNITINKKGIWKMDFWGTGFVQHSDLTSWSENKSKQPAIQMVSEYRIHLNNKIALLIWLWASELFRSHLGSILWNFRDSPVMLIKNCVLGEKAQSYINSWLSRCSTARGSVTWFSVGPTTVKAHRSVLFTESSLVVINKKRLVDFVVTLNNL